MANEFLIIRLDKTTRARFRAACERRGLTMSDALRAAIAEALRAGPQG